jgi:hypothetical protein
MIDLIGPARRIADSAIRRAAVFRLLRVAVPVLRVGCPG